MNWNQEKLEVLKTASKHLVAKTDTFGKNEGRFLPLWMHACDTGGVMQNLFAHRISKKNRDHFSRICGSEEAAEGLFVLLGLIHDIGIASSVFQSSFPRIRGSDVWLIHMLSRIHSISLCSRSCFLMWLPEDREEKKGCTIILFVQP